MRGKMGLHGPLSEKGAGFLSFQQMMPTQAPGQNLWGSIQMSDNRLTARISEFHEPLLLIDSDNRDPTPRINLVADAIELRVENCAWSRAADNSAELEGHDETTG